MPSWRDLKFIQASMHEVGIIIWNSSTKARPKLAFVIPTDKYEFTRCPFRLTQAPVYFQRLINKVLAGLNFAFGYLDDVLIHSPDVPHTFNTYETVVSNG